MCSPGSLFCCSQTIPYQYLLDDEEFLAAGLVVAALRCDGGLERVYSLLEAIVLPVPLLRPLLLPCQGLFQLGKEALEVVQLPLSILPSPSLSLQLLLQRRDDLE